MPHHHVAPATSAAQLAVVEERRWRTTTQTARRAWDAPVPGICNVSRTSLQHVLLACWPAVADVL
jgi:hypothetical protein